MRTRRLEEGKRGRERKASDMIPLFFDSVCLVMMMDDDDGEWSYLLLSSDVLFIVGYYGWMGYCI